MVTCDEEHAPCGRCGNVQEKAFRVKKKAVERRAVSLRPEVKTKHIQKSGVAPMYSKRSSQQGHGPDQGLAMR